MKRTRVIEFLFFSFFVAACTQNSKATKRVYGTVEVSEIDVSSRLTARVKRVAVKAGQRVKAGDVLVEFEDDVLSAKRKQAEAMMAAAKSKRDIAEDAVRPEEKEQLKAAVTAAKRQMEFAKQSLSRAEIAKKEGAISEQALDEVRFKYQAARENYAATEAKQRLANAGARPEERAGAAALLDQATNAVAEVDAFNKDVNLLAPVDGEVFQLLCHEGELVPAGYPVLTILKTDDKWVTFYVAETLLKDFPMGGRVAVNIPALNQSNLSAEISFVSPMASFANRTTTQERGAFDLKTFEVRASLTAAQADTLRPGMTALIGEAAVGRAR